MSKFKLPEHFLTFGTHNECKETMRKIILTTVLFLCTLSTFAGEGMWLPFLLQKINEKDMQAMGLKLSAEDIYSVKDGSLKDAVLIFGGGCTGEVVSDKGLVLTNHHCGYGTVNGLSSVENDYLTDGFFAKNQQQEIPCPGLSVRFIRNIKDVTKDVNKGVTDAMDKKQRSEKQRANLKQLRERAEAATGLEISIKSFFYGNEYYMFYIERYSDVRLVVFPPNGIGKYGGDTDNWAWPRHTGDFSVFRIYANKNNEAAPYSKDNVPYNPKRHLKVNIAGLESGDFTMVYGFPGRTSEYLTSAGINEVMNVLDPARIKIREKRLEIMESAMKESKINFIKYASKQARVANYYKKWQGELLGLKLNDAVNKKRAMEIDFIKWTQKDPVRLNKYGGITNDIISKQAKIYKSKERDELKYNYIRECLKAPELIALGRYGDSLLKYNGQKGNIEHNKRIVKKIANGLKAMDLSTDEKICATLYAMYEDEFGENEVLDQQSIKAMYHSSVFSNTTSLNNLLAMDDQGKIEEALLNDPVYKANRFITQENKIVLGDLRPKLIKLNDNYKIYMQGLREYSKKPLYPDANFTLRLTYGKIEGLEPQDGMQYSYYTTLGGAVRKRNTEVEEFNMPQRLVDLYKRKDFGPYATWHKGRKDVPVCLLSSLHTTGGNSGSPIMNAYGELIGTNFDRIWEGTMSDINYDVNLCRNISVDIRYTLFIIDKFGGAKWVVDEMDIVDKRH